MNLPDPELTPDDLHDYAAAKFDAIREAMASGDYEAMAGHTRDLAAEGSRELAHVFTSGLLGIGLLKLAQVTALTTERDQRTRAAFLEEHAARPDAPAFPDPRWSRGRERRYLLHRAALFSAYATEQAGADANERRIFALGADVTASDLLVWDAVNNTHLGELPAISDRWREDPRGYVAQERLAAELSD